MVKYIFLLGLLVGISACKTSSRMTDKEIALINAGTDSTAMRVLLTTDESDSLFLRSKCVDVDDVVNVGEDKELQLFIERLKVTLEAQSGVGIAAPQVGIGRNLFLFLRIDKEDYPVQVAINPRIVRHSDEVICFEGDGCLSIPDESGNTARYAWVEVEYYDERGKLHTERLSGVSRDEDFTGIIFQHEFDHLNGVLFTDRLVK